MRISLIDPSLFTLPYDVSLARGLTTAGHQVVLHGRKLTASDGDARDMAVQPDFYRVAGSAAVRRLPKQARVAIKGLDHVVSLLRLRARLAAERPDIIHFQWLPVPLLDRAMLAGFRAIAPVVLTVHDTDPFNGSPTARLQKLGFAASLHGCDRLIVHTRQGFARLVKLGLPASKIAILPHGPLIETPVGSAPDPMSGELTFVLFGKIKSYKGADVLIEAFADLPPELRAQAKLRIVGQAYMDVALLQARAASLGVAGRVAIEPRFVADTEMPAIFAPGSVAVFPYREIEASGVLSLAMAHGRPVIASRLGSFAETLEDGVHGWLTPPGDVAALAAAMGSAIKDRAVLAQQSQAVTTRMRAMPGWDEIARLTLGVYADAAAQRSAAQRPGHHASGHKIAL